MITRDDNGDANAYARLKKWREKNRGLVNLRQKTYRARKKVEGMKVEEKAVVERVSKKEVLNGLRRLISDLPEQVVEAPKPTVYRDDYGRVITERQWETLKRKKEDAKEGGYEIDEYSQ